MTTKLLMFSDPHITPKAEFSKPTPDGLTDYLHRLIKSFDWVCGLIAEQRPTHVCCLGDVFESTGYVDTVSLKVAHEVCGRLAEASRRVGAKCVFLVGNHDSYSILHEQHNLHFLERYGIVVVGTPTLIDDVFCVPWTDGTLPAAPDLAKVCITHVDVQGGALYKDHRADFGFGPDAFALATFNGHQHNPCEVWPGFHNIGALASRTFSDADSPPRGVTVYCSASREQRFEANPHDTPFRDVVIDSPVAAQVWTAKIETATAGLDRTCVRIKYDQDYAEVANNLSCFTAGARLEELPRDLAAATENAVNESFTPEENFREYVDQVLIFDEDGDRDNILSLGLSYLKEVKSGDCVHTLPIEFKHVTIQGFHSFGDVSVSLTNRGLVYVEGRNEDEGGSNGSGKSTLAEAIYWCLTGESMRDYRGDDVVHWDHKGCAVCVSLVVGGVPYVISRYRKHSKYKNSVRLSTVVDGIESDVSCRVTKDTNTKVRDLIGRTKDVLRHSVFLSGGLETKFTSLRFPDRIKLIEQITRSDVYGEVYKLVRADATAADLDARQCEGRMHELTARISEVSSKLLRVSGEVRERARDRAATIDRLTAALRGAVKLRVNAAAVVEATKVKVTAAQTATVAFESGAYSKADADLVRLTGELAKATADRDMRRRALVESTRAVANGDCVTCGQPVGESAPLTDKIGTLRREISTLEDRRSLVDAELTSARESHRASRAQLDRLKTTTHLLQSRLAKACASFASCESTESDAKVELLIVKNSGDDLAAVEASLKEDSAALTRSLEEMEKTSKDRERVMQHLNWLEDAFSTKGIRSKMLATSTIPFLNERLKKSSTLLRRYCQLTTKTETKGGDVQDKIDVVLPGKLTYRGCSRGERRKVDFAIQCAFNDLAIATGGSHVNLLICDEVVDPLDDETTARAVEMLSDKSSGMTIFLMAHKPFLRESIQSRMTLVKSNGTTSLEA